ncbi:MAG: DUF3037 domain-containing protein [Dehalococcoidia bacterium]|nr:DUF3037 domain-containing protein [Dehalococcoidia bacterium]
MPACSFDYAIIRVVPSVERGEFVNAGVVVFSREKRYLGAQVELDRGRIQALAPTADLDAIEQHLEVFPLLARGGKDAGPLGELTQAERFHWMTAPRSTIIQVSPVHSGCSDDPAAELEQLMATMVRPPQ